MTQDLDTLVASATRGSTIYLKGGVYNQLLQISPNAATGVTVTAEDPTDMPVIQGIDCYAPGWSFNYLGFAPTQTRKGKTNNGRVVYVDAEEVTIHGCDFDLIRGKQFSTISKLQKNSCNGVVTGTRAHFLRIAKSLFRGVNTAVLPEHQVWGVDLDTCWIDQHLDDAVRMHSQWMQMFNCLVTNARQAGATHVGGGTTFADRIWDPNVGRYMVNQRDYQEGQRWLYNTGIATIDPNDPFGAVCQMMGGQDGYFNLIMAIGNICVTSGYWGGSFAAPQNSWFQNNSAILDPFAKFKSPDKIDQNYATAAQFRIGGQKPPGIMVPNNNVYRGNAAGKHVLPPELAATMVQEGNIILLESQWGAVLPDLDKRNFVPRNVDHGSTLVDWCLNQGKNVWDAPSRDFPVLPALLGEITRPAPVRSGYVPLPPVPPAPTPEPELPESPQAEPQPEEPEIPPSQSPPAPSQPPVEDPPRDVPIDVPQELANIRKTLGTLIVWIAQTAGSPISPAEAAQLLAILDPPTDKGV